MVKRRLKRYEPGGQITSPVPYAQLGDIAGNLFDAVTPTDKYGVKSSFNAGATGALKGAGQGAAMGAIAGPYGAVVGGVVGGVAGAITGKRQNDQLSDEAEKARQLQEQLILQKSGARLATYDTTGSHTNQIYAQMGGKLPTKYVSGGTLKALSSESVEVEGRGHEDGGVKLSPEVEVEGKETIKKDFVYSDVLGFADRHKPLARAIGKMEKKVPNNITTNTINLLKSKEKALEVEQENLKEVLGLKPLTPYMYGGSTNKRQLNLV
jgi:hypothetical protein